MGQGTCSSPYKTQINICSCRYQSPFVYGATTITGTQVEGRVYHLSCTYMKQTICYMSEVVLVMTNMPVTHKLVWGSFDYQIYVFLLCDDTLSHSDHVGSWWQLGDSPNIFFLVYCVGRLCKQVRIALCLADLVPAKKMWGSRITATQPTVFLIQLLCVCTCMYGNWCVCM